jgi:hypothetical protein
VSNALIIGEHPEDLAEALRVLSGCNIALQTRDVVRRARRAYRDEVAIVLFLTERDNIAELRALLSHTGAKVLLVAPSSPPRASLARIANQYKAGLCSREDPRPVREAMLIALATSRTDYAVS